MKIRLNHIYEIIGNLIIDPIFDVIKELLIFRCNISILLCFLKDQNLEIHTEISADEMI